jgi:hypothetical protein
MYHQRGKIFAHEERREGTNHNVSLALLETENRMKIDRWYCSRSGFLFDAQKACV